MLQQLYSTEAYKYILYLGSHTTLKVRSMDIISNLFV